MKDFNTLSSTLQSSIFTWDYFADLKKANLHVKKIEIELNILNYLLGKKDIKNEFIKLIREYPKVRKVLPMLIAVRNSKLGEMDIVSDKIKLTPSNLKYIFNDPLNAKIEKELLIFLSDSGLESFFKDKNVKNLVDYCLGVEVGLDTHARKNRTGSLMENLVSSFLKKFCETNKNFEFIEQATQKRIKEVFGFDIQMDKASRRFDFVLFDKKKNKPFVVEVNYYGSQGSKLKSTAGEYQYLYDFLSKQNIDFIWITDGKGWLSALNSLEETFKHNDYVINLEALGNGILDDICL